MLFLLLYLATCNIFDFRGRNLKEFPEILPSIFWLREGVQHPNKTITHTAGFSSHPGEGLGLEITAAKPRKNNSHVWGSPRRTHSLVLGGWACSDVTVFHSWSLSISFRQGPSKATASLALEIITITWKLLHMKDNLRMSVVN